jgi:hypothetical protein
MKKKFYIYYYLKQIFLLIILFLNNISNAQNITESELIDGVWSGACKIGGTSYFFIKNENNKLSLITFEPGKKYWLYDDIVVKSYFKDGVFYIQIKDYWNRFITLQYFNNSLKTIEISGKNGAGEFSYSENIIKNYCEKNTIAFKNHLDVRARLNNYYSLIKNGAQDTDVINLIVNKAKYLKKKIVIDCTITSASSSGAICYDLNGKQFIEIDAKGIEKEFYKYILLNCNKLFSSENNNQCSEFFLQGVVEDGKYIKLINVSEI